MLEIPQGPPARLVHGHPGRRHRALRRHGLLSRVAIAPRDGGRAAHVARAPARPGVAAGAGRHVRPRPAGRRPHRRGRRRSGDVSHALDRRGRSHRSIGGRDGHSAPRRPRRPQPRRPARSDDDRRVWRIRARRPGSRGDPPRRLVAGRADRDRRPGRAGRVARRRMAARRPRARAAPRVARAATPLHGRRVARAADAAHRRSRPRRNGRSRATAPPPSTASRSRRASARRAGWNPW